MKIERAVREKTFTLTSIAGPSGSGKTYSAILYARGLVGPEGKIGFIDTENKRSRFYADVAGGFDVIDLDAPFTSARYIEAIRAFEDAGYKAIIIDSISHEWEGTGGVLEQADAIEQATKRAGLHCWAKPKAGHKKLMNELLQTRAHLIFCCRVKEKVVQVKGTNGKAEIVNEGFVVVQEKMFIYEMTVSMMLEEGSHIPTIQKCPGDLEAAFPSGRKITVDVGASVAKWSDQGIAIDQDLEAAKREGLLAANKGTASLHEWWKGLGSQQAKLAGMKDTFKSIANAADQMKADIHEAGGGDLRDRLAHRAAQTEGFDPSHVARETAALDNDPAGTIEDEPGLFQSSPAPLTGADGGSDDTQSPGEVAAASPDDVDHEYLTEFARIIVASTNGTDETVVVNMAKGLYRDGLSEQTRAKARSIINYAREACRGELEVPTMLDLIAGVAGCDEADLKGGAS